MTEIPSTKATEKIVNGEYVASATTSLRSGKLIGQAELKVPASAVDVGVVGESAARQLKEGLEMAVQALAQHDAKINGLWPQ